MSIVIIAMIDLQYRKKFSQQTEAITTNTKQVSSFTLFRCVLLLCVQLFPHKWNTTMITNLKINC